MHDYINHGRGNVSIVVKEAAAQSRAEQWRAELMRAVPDERDFKSWYALCGTTAHLEPTPFSPAEAAAICEATRMCLCSSLPIAPTLLLEQVVATRALYSITPRYRDSLTNGITQL